MKTVVRVVVVGLIACVVVFLLLALVSPRQAASLLPSTDREFVWVQDSDISHELYFDTEESYVGFIIKYHDSKYRWYGCQREGFSTTMLTAKTKAEQACEPYRSTRR